MAYAIGEFSILELLKHHINDVQKIIVSDEKEKKKYFSFKKEVIIDKKFLLKEVKKEDIYALAIFTPYSMKLDKKSTHILINDLSDEGEIGTIIRTAIAFDYFDIALINTNISLFSAKLIRASVGAFFLANIEQFNNIEEYKKKYQNKAIAFYNNKKEFLSLKVAQELYKIKAHQRDNR